MDSTESRIAQMLMNKGVLGRNQHRLVMDRRSDKGGTFHMLVLEMGLAPEETVADIVAQVTNLQRISLSKMQPERRAIDKLPAKFCLRNCVFPYAVRGGGKILWLVMANPLDLQVRNEALVLSGLKSLRPFVAPPGEIRALIEKCMETESAESVSPANAEALFETSEAFDSKPTHTHPAATRLFDNMDGIQGEAVFDPEQKSNETEELLERLISGQQKASRFLSALVKACVAKGLFSDEELRTRLGK